MPPNVLKAALAGALTLLENGIYKLQGPKNSAKWLWGNFQPIPPPADLFAADLPIEGRLPPELTGLFARNGPNPVHINSGLHWFDGDGFIHAVMLDAITQRANYSAQLVRTNKLKQEMAAGRALFHKFGDAEGPLTLGLMMIEKARIGLGIVDVTRGRYGGNTALLWHAGQFFALHEGEQPHLLRVEDDGRIATVGLVHKAGAEPSSFFTAHPKVDPHTHKLYAFGYDLEKPPYNTYYQLDEDGEVVRLVPFKKWAKPAMVHDFSITENYAVFFEASLYIDPPQLLKGQPLFRFDEGKPLRFAVLPLDAKTEAEAKWFEAKPGYIFHTANSWEEEGGKVIRVLAARYDHFELNFDGTIDKNLTEQAMTFSREELDRRSTHLHEYTLDMESGELKERRLVTQEMDGRSHEFPQVHPLLLGRRTRYVYMTAYDGKGEPAALVKVDLEAEGGLALQTLDLGEETYAGEAIFVPKEGSQTGAEDEGYLLTFTYSYKTNSSDFRVYDARTMSSTPVARVPLPRRVPYGFHAIWVPQEELNHQKCPAGLMGEGQQAQAA